MIKHPDADADQASEYNGNIIEGVVVQELKYVTSAHALQFGIIYDDIELPIRPQVHF